jgi:myo-inositol-1(or 4)-monophosphatase
MDLQNIKHVGISAALNGGRTLMKYFGKAFDIRKKGAIDLVTQADIESENVIIETLRGSFPEHTILAEESGLNSGCADCRWIIDPLDGTTNFAHQLGFFAVSIAFARNNDLCFGVVFDPVTEELFVGVRGEGATLNGRPISVSKVRRIEDSFLVTGFPYNLKDFLSDVSLRFSRCLGASLGVRRLGAASIDLCYLACGRFDGFWEQNLKPWDTAAGWVVATEAGASISDFSNRPFSIYLNEILATNGNIHEDMISLLALKESQ